MVLLVNQHTVPVFTDVINAFADTEEETILFSGHVEAGGQKLSNRVRWVRSFKYNRKTPLTRLLSWLLFSAHYVFFLLGAKKPARILVVTNPPAAPLVTAFIARFRRIPFYILVFDLYPEALAQAGFLQQESRLFQLWKKVNPWFLKKAEKVFTLSESMKDALSPYMPGHTEKIKVIHNWADVNYIRPVPKKSNVFLQRNNLLQKKIVLYSGNMGLTHDLESLVGAAEILRSEKDILFVLIGEGGKKKLLEKMASSKDLDNVIFLPYQDSQNFPLAMAGADIGVVTLGKGGEGISVPSKTYANLAAGLCLLAIAPENSELSRLVQNHHAGIICVPGDVSGVAEKIKRLFSDEALLRQYKMNALKASVNFTSENARRYVQETIFV